MVAPGSVDFLYEESSTIADGLALFDALDYTGDRPSTPGIRVPSSTDRVWALAKHATGSRRTKFVCANGNGLSPVPRITSASHLVFSARNCVCTLRGDTGNKSGASLIAVLSNDDEKPQATTFTVASVIFAAILCDFRGVFDGPVETTPESPSTSNNTRNYRSNPTRYQPYLVPHSI
ncbi:hypothetical protein ONZ45_g2907 [Pleurotus djamor]|nr:hypothetical protein ONZ45_g2907 [Pleurotus djamor]